jgi:phage baseplate assembly protein W
MKYLPSDFNNIFIEGVNGVRQPSNTYKMKIEEERVDGKIVDEVEAVKQAVYKILNTERYKHIIYSTDYGVELADLFGKPIPYVLPEIPRRITEALLVDDRIKKVDSFELDYTKKGDVTCLFVVHSIFGAFDVEKKVTIK